MASCTITQPTFGHHSRKLFPVKASLLLNALCTSFIGHRDLNNGDMLHKTDCD